MWKYNNYANIDVLYVIILIICDLIKQNESELANIDF